MLYIVTYYLDSDWLHSGYILKYSFITKEVTFLHISGGFVDELFTCDKNSFFKKLFKLPKDSMIIPYLFILRQL